jgi:hypothetical protein
MLDDCRLKLGFAVIVRPGERVNVSDDTLAAEEAVGAVAEAGKRTGRVGDFGRGFTKPVLWEGFASVEPEGVERCIFGEP